MKQPKRRSGEGQGLGVVLRKQQSVELRHEAVIQGGELFEAVRAGLLQLLEEEYLMARIQLFEELPKLRVGPSPSWPPPFCAARSSYS